MELNLLSLVIKFCSSLLNFSNSLCKSCTDNSPSISGSSVNKNKIKFVSSRERGKHHRVRSPQLYSLQTGSESYKFSQQPLSCSCISHSPLKLSLKIQIKFWSTVSSNWREPTMMNCINPWYCMFGHCRRWTIFSKICFGRCRVTAEQDREKGDEECIYCILRMPEGQGKSNIK